MFEQTLTHGFFSKIIRALKPEIFFPGREEALGDLKLWELLPRTSEYITYEGSQTMPGCQVHSGAMPRCQILGQTMPRCRVHSWTIPGCQVLIRTIPGSQVQSQTMPECQVHIRTMPECQVHSRTMPGYQVHSLTMPGCQEQIIRLLALYYVHMSVCHTLDTGMDRVIMYQGCQALHIQVTALLCTHGLAGTYEQVTGNVYAGCQVHFYRLLLLSMIGC